MPRLPTVDSLGARPVPRSGRAIATQRYAGAVGEALTSVGNQLSRMAEERLEREDKITYGAAHSALLRADINARSELRDDPDYGTFESRYNEKMAKAREAASQVIRSRSDRQIFDLDSSVDIERGLGEVREMARGKRNAARGALVGGSLQTLRASARDASDDATREAIINTATTLIDGAVAEGVIDPGKAVDLRAGFANDHAGEVINLALNTGDPAKARAALNRWGKFLTTDNFISMSREVDRLEDDTIVMGAASRSVAAPGTSRLQMPVKGEITDVVGSARPGGRRHAGIDIAVPEGSPVRAPAGGRVSAVWNDVNGGLSVKIDHGGGVVTGYAHLSRQDVRVGDHVEAGQVFASSGNTGRSKGPHLHWTARVNGQTVDPRTVRFGSSRPGTVEDAISAAVAELGPNPEPRLIEAVRKEVVTRWGIREQAEKEREEDVVEAAQAELVKNGGNWRALPASVKRAIPAKFHPGLIDFADGVREPSLKRDTDPQTYVTLTDMAATDPAGFASINPITYRAKMSNSDWESFVKLRGEILEGGSKQRVTIETIRQVTRGALDANGLTTEGLGQKNDRSGAKRRAVAAQVYNHEKAVVADLAIWQQANPGRVPTIADIQAIADRRLMLVTPMDGGKPVFEFQQRGPGKVRIPTADVVRIRGIMKSVLMREPTEEEIVAAYKREARGGL